jgi:hypothetical protein
VVLNNGTSSTLDGEDTSDLENNVCNLLLALNASNSLENA